MNTISSNIENQTSPPPVNSSNDMENGPPELLKHHSNSTFFGSASPRELETDFDTYAQAAMDSDVGDVITDDDSDDNEEEVIEYKTEAKEMDKQKSFIIELCSRSDLSINTNELLVKFNAAINQSLHEYAIEWLCVLFRNYLVMFENKKDKTLCNMIHLYLIKPIVSVVSDSIKLSNIKTNLKLLTISKRRTYNLFT